MATYRVKVNVPGLKSLRRVAETNFAAGSHPAVDRMCKQWSVRYSSFARRRYDVYSRGGGDWPPLALSTILRRRLGAAHFRKGDTFQSLFHRRKGLKTRGQELRRVKGQLARELARTGDTVAAGAKLKRLIRLSQRAKYLPSMQGISILRDTGITFLALQIGAVGNMDIRIPGGIRFGYAEAPHAGSKRTIANIAGYHQAGGRYLPQRKIIVQPDDRTRRGIASDLGRALVAVGNNRPVTGGGEA